MGRPAKTLRIKHSKLWPSEVCAGSTIIKFLLTKSGKQVQVIQRDGRKPKHIPLTRTSPKD